MPRHWLVAELWLVFALPLGAASVRAAISLLAGISSGVPLADQAAVRSSPR